MRRRFVVASLVALVTALAATAATPLAAKPKTDGPLVVPFTAADGVTGNLSIVEFVNRNGALYAIANVTATRTIAATGRVEGVLTQVTLPVAISTSPALTGVVAQQISCPILHLELGPLDLNVLGLVVHLDRVVLDISAEPGDGNLLGNLLCAIAGLLNGGSPLTQILNQLVNLLNDLIAGL